VLELELELERARVEIARMRERADRIEQRMNEEIDRVRRSLRAEIVPYGAYESKQRMPAPGSRPQGGEAADARRVSIPIERQRRRGGR